MLIAFITIQEYQDQHSLCCSLPMIIWFLVPMWVIPKLSFLKLKKTLLMMKSIIPSSPSSIVLSTRENSRGYKGTEETSRCLETSSLEREEQTAFTSKEIKSNLPCIYRDQSAIPNHALLASSVSLVRIFPLTYLNDSLDVSITQLKTKDYNYLILLGTASLYHNFGLPSIKDKTRRQLKTYVEQNGTERVPEQL